MKKALTLLLCLAIVCSVLPMVPLTALAEETQDDVLAVEWTHANGNGYSITKGGPFSALEWAEGETVKEVKLVVYSYVAATGHTPDREAADCTNDQVCTVCHAVLDEKTGHNYTAVVTAPTCTAQGYTTHTCEGCGDEYVDTYVAATGHTPDREAADCTNDQVCTVCHAVLDEKTGHNYTTVVTAPTCTAQGYTTHTCEGCGDEFVDTYVAATGHTFVEGVCTVCSAKDPDYVDLTKPYLMLTNGEGLTGGTVTMELWVKNNPGFAALNMALVYDTDVLTLTDVKNETALSMTNGLSIVWDGTADLTGDVLLATLTFAVAEGAALGDYTVEIKFFDASNAKIQIVNFQTVDGTVTVVDFVYGDVNGDRVINTLDLALIRQYLANKDPMTGISSVEIGYGTDANGDGSVNTLDLALLRQYLANKDPMTGESSVILGPKA